MMYLLLRGRKNRKCTKHSKKLCKKGGVTIHTHRQHTHKHTNQTQAFPHTKHHASANTQRPSSVTHHLLHSRVNQWTQNNTHTKQESPFSLNIKLLNFFLKPFKYRLSLYKSFSGLCFELSGWWSFIFIEQEHGLTSAIIQKLPLLLSDSSSSVKVLDYQMYFKLYR